MTSIRSVCVYCGSRMGNDSRHRAATELFGRLLAEQGIRLIYGGGRIGLMGVLADAVMGSGGNVVGIIPELLETREVGHRGIDELRVVSSMHERKNLMFEMADAFVVLSGGLGTLDEAFEMLTWRQLGLHDKPIILVDIDGYWQPLLRLIDHVIEQGFAPPESRALFAIVSGIEEIVPALVRAPAPALPDALDRL